MLSSEDVRDLVERRTRRAIAILLSFKEKNADKYLPEEVQVALRSSILDEINELSSLFLDVIDYFEEK
jgi:hypothetical protein